LLPLQIITAGWQRVFGVVGVGYAAMALGFDFSLFRGMQAAELVVDAPNELLNVAGPLAALFLAYVIGELIFGFGRVLLTTGIYASAHSRDFETLVVLSDDQNVGAETRLAITRSLLLLELFAAISVVGVAWMIYSLEPSIRTMDIFPFVPPLSVTMLALMFARTNQSRAELYLLLSEEKRLNQLTLGAITESKNRNISTP